MTNEEKFRKRVGEDVVSLLEHMGFNISKIYNNSVKKDLEKLEILGKTIKEAGLNAIMTSELIYLSKAVGFQLAHDVYMEEWVRRMNQIGLDNKQMTILFDRDELALSSDVKHRDSLWVTRTPFGEGITKDDVPPVEHLTWSEINLFTDYARYLKAVAHESLSEEAWQAVAEQAYNQKLAFALKEWYEANDIPQESMNTFWYNEGSLLAEFKYGYGKNQSLWRVKK